MVDIAAKTQTQREASASAKVITRPDVVALIAQAALKKGDALATARVAGIMAAKKTSELIPLCHPIALTKVTIDFQLFHEAGEILIQSRCSVYGATGVEMEALTAVSVAALTLHDMAKAVDPGIRITDIYLLEKIGGKSGIWQRSDII